ncbi:MAG: AbrB/MazE/SpoVT family DNA-binding domain-containing protein [Candidatus Woesearchaeota archaeon]
MEVAITKMSSKGQIVIPRQMRNNIKEGEKLIIIEQNNQFYLKRINDIHENFESDLLFAQKTNVILDRYEAGDKVFKKMSKKEFLEELESW